MSDNPRALIRYALVGAALTVFISWALFLLRDTLLLLYIAALIAIGLSPIVTFIQRRRDRRGTQRLPRWVAILIIYLAVIGALVGVALMVVPPLVAQARALWSAAPEILHQAQTWLLQRGLIRREVSMQEIAASVPGGDVVGTVIGASVAVIGGVFGVITVLIIAFYLLVDAESILQQFLRLFPRPERPRVHDACRRVATKVSAWLNGQLLLAAIIGSTAAFALCLLGVPYFYVLALIAGVGEMIPIVGPLLSAIPAVVIAFTVSPALGISVAAFFLLQQQVENHLLVPKIMERQVGVSAVVVIIALLLGGSLLGIVGAILAVPTAAILQVLFQELVPEATTD